MPQRGYLQGVPNAYKDESIVHISYKRKPPLPQRRVLTHLHDLPIPQPVHLVHWPQPREHQAATHTNLSSKFKGIEEWLPLSIQFSMAIL